MNDKDRDIISLKYSSYCVSCDENYKGHVYKMDYRNELEEITDKLTNAQKNELIKDLIFVVSELALKQTDMLNKIRTEIENVIQKETVIDHSGGKYESIISKLDPDDVLQIIDKCRGESEK